MLLFTIGFILTLIGLIMMAMGIGAIVWILLHNPLFSGIVGFVFGRKTAKKKN